MAEVGVKLRVAKLEGATQNASEKKHASYKVYIKACFC